MLLPRAMPHGVCFLALGDDKGALWRAAGRSRKLSDRYTGVEDNYFRFPCTSFRGMAEPRNAPNGLEWNMAIFHTKYLVEAGLSSRDVPAQPPVGQDGGAGQ